MGGMVRQSPEGAFSARDAIPRRSSTELRDLARAEELLAERDAALERVAELEAKIEKGVQYEGRTS